MQNQADQGSPLLKEERQQFILTQLEQAGKVIAAELAAQLQVSEDTIRRDLRDLAEMGMIQRVHGGALRLSPGRPAFDVRAQQAAEAKARIAAAGAALVRPGQLLVIDGGTTNVQLAKALPRTLRAIVVTNSLPVGLALADHPQIDVILIGGRLYKSSLVTIGAATVNDMQQFNADLCFLGVCSLHPEHGITDLDYEEAQVKRTMIDSAAEVVALAAADKLDAAAPFALAPLRDLTLLITDVAVGEARLAPYRAAGLQVLAV